MKRFFRNIKKMFEWFPIIWKDQDWDQAYIYKLLIYKIRRNAKSMRDKDFIQDSEYYADRMDLVANLLEKVYSEYYIDKGFDCTETNSWVDEKGFYQNEIVSVNIDGFFNLYKKEQEKAVIQLINKADSIDSLEFKMLVAHQLGYNLHVKCKRIAFKLLEKDIDKWWW